MWKTPEGIFAKAVQRYVISTVHGMSYDYSEFTDHVTKDTETRSDTPCLSFSSARSQSGGGHDDIQQTAQSLALEYG